MALINRSKVCNRLRLSAVCAALALSLAVGAMPTAAQAPAPGEATLNEGPAATSTPPRGPLPGFIFSRGRYVSFEAPDPRVRIFPVDINDRGVIVGEYIIANSKESAMLRDKRGRIASFDVPGALGTEGVGINDRGQIVGTYSEDTPIVNNSARPRAYIIDRFGRGKVTRIDFPGATVTVASGVNNRGQVVGGYLDGTGRAHGYRWENGRFTTIDVPGAAASAVGGINDRGDMVGVFGADPNDPTGALGVRGFLLSGGVYRRFAAPGFAFTQPFAINNRGEIVGSLVSEAALTEAHGFLLAKRDFSRFVRIDFPDAPRTLANGINDRGQIVGGYENPNAAPGRGPSRMRLPMAMSLLQRPAAE